jgi:hypothetical protein
VTHLFDGKATQLVLQLIDSKLLDADELRSALRGRKS